MQQGRREREIGITINRTNPQADEYTGSIMEKIKKAMGEQAHEALALRKLPSGDLIFQVATAEAKEALARNVN